MLSIVWERSMSGSGSLMQIGPTLYQHHLFRINDGQQLATAPSNHCRQPAAKLLQCPHITTLLQYLPHLAGCSHSHVATTITLVNSNNHQPPIISSLLLLTEAMISSFHRRAVVPLSLICLSSPMRDARCCDGWAQANAMVVDDGSTSSLPISLKEKTTGDSFHSIISRHLLLFACLKLINANPSLKSAPTG